MGQAVSETDGRSQANAVRLKKWGAVRALLYIVVVAVIGILAKQIIDSFDALSALPWFKHPGLLFIHVALLALVFMLLAAGWSHVLTSFGQSVAYADAAGCWLVSNAGKYIPGKVFMFAGRVALCVKLGVRQAACLWALAIEHFFLLLATLPFLVVALLQGYTPNVVLGYALAAIVLVAMVLLVRPKLFLLLINKILIRMRREPLAVAPTPGDMLLLAVVYVGTWTLYGLSGVVLSYALEIHTTMSATTLAAAFVTAWLLGFLSMLTPGGIGVREAALVILLQSQIATHEAIALAVLARATWTLVEITCAGVGW